MSIATSKTNFTPAVRLALLATALYSSAVFAAVSPSTFAAETGAPVEVRIFWAEGCPHCERARTFLSELAQRRPEVAVREYEITTNGKNAELLVETGRELSADVSGVPFIVVGGRYFSGFLDSRTTGAEIEAAVDEVLSDGSAEAAEPTIKLPIVGEVYVKRVPLPLLTVLVALLDGFNPCAMWVLLFLISLLLGMKDRRRMWILGVTFMVASAAVYFLFLAAWLNLFLLIGFIFWVRWAVGLLAIVAGAYYLRDFWVNRTGGCGVLGDERRQKIFGKARAAIGQRGLAAAMLGLAVLAAAVNLIELTCSAGLPAIYTHILSLTSLPAWQYYAYLLLYILIFLFDDIAVFVVAMVTLRAVGVESKYARAARLVGGLFLTAIGFIMLVRPGLLMFG
jgi:glutaredoxin